MLRNDSRLRSLRRLRRVIMRVFLRLLPKKMYSTTPNTGTISNTVIHASDFTGLRFSDSTTATRLMMVPAYANNSKMLYQAIDPLSGNAGAPLS